MTRAPRVAVVGAGIGGLVAAGVLARAGARVTLFEQSDVVGGKARRLVAGSTVLDTGPTLLTMPATVRGAFDAMGAGAAVPPFVALEPQCLYRWPDGRGFQVHADLGATRDAVEAMAPGEGAGVESFYAEAARIHAGAGAPYLDAPYQGFAGFMSRVLRRGPSAALVGIRMSTLDALAAKHFRTPELRQFVGRFATYTGASPYRASAAFSLIPHLERVEGVHHVRGGMRTLVDALERAVRGLGVDVVLGARARWTRQGGGWRVGPAGDEAPADAVVVNADPLAPQGRTGEPLAMSGYVLLLESSVRSALPHHAVLFSRDYRAEFDAIFGGRAPADPTVYVCHPAASDASMAAAGTSGLFVMANVPPSGAALDPELPALRARCLEAVERLDGTLRGRLRVLGERTPADFERLGAPGGSLYGFLPHGRFGPFRRPALRGRDGVVYAGGGTHPGGGVPMVMLSGRWAAGLVARELAGRGASVDAARTALGSGEARA